MRGSDYCPQPEELRILRALMSIHNYCSIPQTARFAHIPLTHMNKFIDTLEKRRLIINRGGKRMMNPYEITKEFLTKGRSPQCLYKKVEKEYKITREGIFFYSDYCLRQKQTT